MQTLITPKRCYPFLGQVSRWSLPLAGLLLSIGLVWGLGFAPIDYQQGDAYRILFVHVPCAALSLGLYVALAVVSVIKLIWRLKLADRIAVAIAPLGAMLTGLALVTGSIWGKPMWGTWWIWDARLTSELVLLFLYWGVIALRQAIPDPERGARAAAILAIIGVIDIPIIHFSVEWWHTLHQGASILHLARPSMPAAMFEPLLLMFAGLSAYVVTILCWRTRAEIARCDGVTND